MDKNYFKDSVVHNINIVAAEESHFEQIWQIFHQVVKAGDSYVYDPETTKEQAQTIWMKQPGVLFYVASFENKVAGTYIMHRYLS